MRLIRVFPGEGEGMPVLTTAADIRSHLKAAMTGRAHWVFLFDQHPRAWLFGVELLGMLLPRCEADEVYLGFFDFRNLPTRHAGRIRFVTVPKDRLSRDELAGLLAAGDWTFDLTDQDTVLLGAPESDDLLTAAALSAQAGFLLPGRPVGN